MDAVVSRTGEPEFYRNPNVNWTHTEKGPLLRRCVFYCQGLLLETGDWRRDEDGVPETGPTGRMSSKSSEHLRATGTILVETEVGWDIRGTEKGP